MKITITAAILAISLMSTSSAFADETQSLVSDSSMQISKISAAQDFSAFDGVETFDVSKAELAEATGNGLYSQYMVRRSMFRNVYFLKCFFSGCGGPVAVASPMNSSGF